MADRWVCLDVGETLIDETRVWTCWANALEMTPFTFMAGLGAVLAAGGDFRDVFDFVGRPDWEDFRGPVEAAYGGFMETDLYSDAKPSLDALRSSGHRVAIVGNQPAERTAQLLSLGVEAEVMAMSGELGAHKPAPEFFDAALRLMGHPDPADVAYVGDRLDNDVKPSAEAGMRPVWIKRGPWALITREVPPAGTLVVSSLTELTARIGEAW